LWRSNIYPPTHSRELRHTLVSILFFSLILICACLYNTNSIITTCSRLLLYHEITKHLGFILCWMPVSTSVEFVACKHAHTRTIQKQAGRDAHTRTIQIQKMQWCMRTHTCKKYIYTSEFLCTLGQEILNRRLSCMFLACKSQVSCLFLVLCLRACMYACMRACRYVCIFVYMYQHTYVYMYSRMCMYTCISRTQANYHLHWDRT